MHSSYINVALTTIALATFNLYLTKELYYSKSKLKNNDELNPMKFFICNNKDFKKDKLIMKV